MISWKKFWKFRFLRLRYFFRENKTVVNFCYLRFHGKDSENSENDAFYDYVIFSVKIERLLTFAMFDFTEKSRKWRFSRLRYFFRENKTAVANVCYIWFHRNFSKSISLIIFLSLRKFVKTVLIWRKFFGEIVQNSGTNPLTLFFCLHRLRVPARMAWGVEPRRRTGKFKYYRRRLWYQRLLSQAPGWHLRYLQ